MSKNADTYIVIPVYNEEAVISAVLAHVLKKYSNVICVNDGSSDRSAEQVKKTTAILINHPINLGAGAATQTGVDFALMDKGAKYFITIDADGQHDISDGDKMLKYLKQHDLDIVLGSRFLGQIENISYAKLIFLRLAAVFSSLTTHAKLTDPHIGLRVFNRRFAEALKLSLADFAHASELALRISEGGFAYGEVPVRVTYTTYSRHKGQSMINAVNIVFDVFLNRISKK